MPKDHLEFSALTPLGERLTQISRAPGAFVREVFSPPPVDARTLPGTNLPDPNHVGYGSPESPSDATRTAPLLQRVLAPSDGALAALLGTVAGVLFATSLFHGFAMPLTPGRLQKAAAQLISEVPLWAWIQSVAPSGLSHAPSVSLLILVFAGASFLAYVLAVLAVWNQRTGVAPVATAVLASVILFQTSVWYLPNESTDLYNYILRGRIAAVHGSNPYSVAADEFPEDPIYPFASHRHTSYAGGKFPTWMLVNIGLARIAGDDPVRNVFTYRTALFLFNLANLALIASILARIAPQRMLFGIVLFGFNPIVFMYGQSKTDTVIVFFLLSSIWLLSRARHRLAVVFLGASVFVKLITAPLLVVHLLREFRTCGWRASVWSAALLTLTVAALYAPFIRTPDLILGHIFIASENADGSGPILKIGLLLLCVLLGLRRKDGLESLLRAWAVVLLYFSLFFASFAMSWYMLTLIAVISLVGEGRLVCAACALVFSSITINSWNHTSSALFPLALPVPLSRQLAYFLPLGVLATGIFVALLHRRHRERRNARA